MDYRKSEPACRDRDESLGDRERLFHELKLLVRWRRDRGF